MGRDTRTVVDCVLVPYGNLRNWSRRSFASQQIEDNVEDVRSVDPPAPRDLINTRTDLLQKLAVHFVFRDVCRAGRALWNPVLFAKFFHKFGVTFRVSSDFGLFSLLHFTR